MAVSAVSLALNRLSQCPFSIACSLVVVIVFGVVSNLFEGVSQTYANLSRSASVRIIILGV